MKRPLHRPAQYLEDICQNKYVAVKIQTGRMVYLQRIAKSQMPLPPRTKLNGRDNDHRLLLSLRGQF